MKKTALILFLFLTSLNASAAIALSDQSLDSVELSKDHVQASRSLSTFAAVEITYEFVEIQGEFNEENNSADHNDLGER